MLAVRGCSSSRESTILPIISMVKQLSRISTQTAAVGSGKSIHGASSTLALIALRLLLVQESFVMCVHKMYKYVTQKRPNSKG